MARFISKSSNLLIVLRPGFPAQPITGTPAKPTLSVRFKDGLADVPDGELTDLMMAHAGFNSDFILAEIGDPYASTRQPSEPTHVITEMKYGTPTARQVTGDKVQFSPDVMKSLTDIAASMAKAMFTQWKEEEKAKSEPKEEEKSYPQKSEVKPTTKGKKVVEEEPRAAVDAS